jgi:hypothetical protein
MAGSSSTLIRIGSAAGMLVGTAALLFSTSAAAGASGSSSPPAGTTPVTCSSSQTLTVNPNVTTNFTLATPAACDFASGSSVGLTYNGTTLPALTAPSGGAVTLSGGATDPPHIALNGGAAMVATWNDNEVVLTGTTTSGASDTVTFVIDLVQPAKAATAATAGAGSSGTLAFTGADLLALVLAALALILLGSGTVYYTRRRAERLHS